MGLSGLPKTGAGGVTIGLGSVGLGTVHMPMWVALTTTSLALIGVGIVLVRLSWRRGKPVNAR